MSYDMTQIKTFPWWGVTRDGRKARIDFCRPDIPDGGRNKYRWVGYIKVHDGWDEVTFADCGAFCYNKVSPQDIVGPLEDPPAQDPAADLLLDALTIVTGARRQTYGTPEDNFSKIAALWRTYLEMRFPGVPTPGLSPTDVALMMNLMKVARLVESPEHKDSWQDLAGYAACGWRCAWRCASRCASRNAPEEPES